MDKQRLKALILMNDGKQEKLAEAMGISLSRLNAKINESNAEFTQREMGFIIERYHLSDKEVREIFFARIVS